MILCLRAFVALNSRNKFLPLRHEGTKAAIAAKKIFSLRLKNWAVTILHLNLLSVFA